MSIAEISLVVLKILLILYILQSLIKFGIHFLAKYESRMEKIVSYYDSGERKLKRFDAITLGLAIIFVLLLFLSGEMEYLNFTTGFLVGLTLLQIYFHRFNQPLPPDKSPEQGASPIKHISYAIQEKPQRAWREYLLMTILLTWGLYMLLVNLF